MAQLIGYLSEGEQLQGRLSDPDRLVGELSMPVFLGGGLSEEVKQALLDLFAHLAYTDADGQDYYAALYNAFYPPAELVSISAVYTQSGAVFEDTPLDDLKDDLVVTANYSDGTSEAVTTYTLSGTLTVGTSVITVTYEDKTTTFNVTVSAPATLSSITAVYTQSGVVYPTDSLDSLKSDLVVTAHYSDSSTATVTTYTLSGTLTVGTSTITVTYSGKTTTFNVTVTAVPVLDSITAVYTQSGTVYDTDSLDSLKADLVVTAVYTDSSTEVVPSTDYTLSGTLTVGTSTVTVSYEGKTATFSVTVSDSGGIPFGYTAHDYIQSNGDAYINTEINEKPGTTTGYWGIFEAHNAGTNAKNLFGYDGVASGMSSTYRFCMVLSTANVLNYYGAASGLSSALSGWDDQAANDITVTYSSSSNYPSITIDAVQNTGNKAKTASTAQTIPPLYLMAKNYQAGGPTNADKAVDGTYIRCYGFKIFENSVAVAHFVPAVRDLDSTAGFYDLVRRTFYPSIGANAFTAGDNT